MKISDFLKLLFEEKKKNISRGLNFRDYDELAKISAFTVLIIVLACSADSLSPY